MALEQFFGEPTDDTDRELNLLVPYYIMMAYRYYEKDDPMVSDRLFDLTAKKLLKHWDGITHMHNDYLNTDMLEAGTYSGEYPSMAIGACYAVPNKIFEKRLKRILDL